MKRITTPQLLLLRIEIYFADIEISRDIINKLFCYIGSKHYYFSFRFLNEVMGKKSSNRLVYTMANLLFEETSPYLEYYIALIKHLEINI